MSAFFGSDGSFPFQFATIFAVIFVVLAGLVLLVRRFAGGGLSAAAKAGSRGRQPRLGIVDVYELDRQRQLILLRRDNVEHLLLVGGPNDVVVERNISRGGLRLAADTTTRDEEDDHAPPLTEPTLPPPLEPVFPPREPAPALRAGIVPDLTAERRTAGEPAFAPAPPVEPAFVEPKPAAATFAAPAFSAPAISASPAVPAEPAQPARRDAPSLPARILRRTPPPLVNPKPDVASERARASEPPALAMPTAPAPTRPSVIAEPDFEAAFAAALAAPAPAASAPTPPPVPPSPFSPPAPPAEPAPAAKVDAAILSDMARQLEEALRRPEVAPAPVIPQVDLAREIPEETSEETPRETAREAAQEISHDVSEPVRQPAHAPAGEDAARHVAAEPEPAAEAPHGLEDLTVMEEVAKAEPAPSTDPMAAAMASAAEPSTEGDGLFEEPAPAAGLAPLPPPPAEPKPASVEPKPASVEPKPAPPRPEPAKPAAPAPTSGNPFSVEEIEAEFARLLGRPLDRPLDRKN